MSDTFTHQVFLPAIRSISVKRNMVCRNIKISRHASAFAEVFAESKDSKLASPNPVVHRLDEAGPLCYLKRAVSLSFWMRCVRLSLTE
jgi:hypothetical protein